MSIWTRSSGGLVAIQLFGIFGSTTFLYNIRGVVLTVQRIKIFPEVTEITHYLFNDLRLVIQASFFLAGLGVVL